MDDNGELAGFRADNPESQQESQQFVKADSETQERWNLYVDLMLQGKRMVQGGQIIQEKRYGKR